MNIHSSNIFSRRQNFFGTMLAIALMVPGVVLSQLSTYTNPLTVPLGAAGTYGALAYSGITGTATVNGDIGTTTASIGSITVVNGTNWGVGGTENGNAQTALTAALTNANDHVARPTDFTIPANLDGLTLYKGIYDGGALDLASSGTLTLNGNATDIFVIRAASTLTINTNSTVALTGGAVWSNVFWYVGTSATIYSGTTFNGIVLASESITLNASATLVTARLLASTGAVSIGSTVLPVELVSFTATSDRTITNLHWSTATEVNNFGFEIQRSSDKNWMKAGFVEGNGTSNAPKDYSFTDNNLSTGKYSYRLKQIDRDGKFTYSQSVEVTIGQSVKEFGLAQNYPNPFNPSTVINYQLPGTSSVTLTVYDAIGREVSTLVNEVKEAGNYSVQFNASHLSNGIYFYTIKAGSFTATKKLSLLK